MIKLGSKVRDSVTQLTGTATARMEVLHGTPRVCVEPIASEAKPAETCWFDEARLYTAQDEDSGEDSSSQ